MSRVTIVGAGLAGLLAANMLRRSDVRIIEAQPSLPNNHSAVLRFRTNKVALQTGIPFCKVPVFKAIHDPINPVADALAYARKTSGRLELRSILKLEPCERFIAPPDLVARMATGMAIEWETPLTETELAGNDNPVLSTIPMPVLMDLLKYPGERPPFNHESGTTIKARLANAEVYASIYFPRERDLPYRASITGDELIVECMHRLPPDLHWKAVTQALQAFGLDGRVLAEEPLRERHTPYAKIARLSGRDRRLAQEFMFWASTTCNIYSVGRFATWRAGLLLDDVVDDVVKIEGWINSGPYTIRKDV